MLPGELAWVCSVRGGEAVKGEEERRKTRANGKLTRRQAGTNNNNNNIDDEVAEAEGKETQTRNSSDRGYTGMLQVSRKRLEESDCTF